MRFGIRNQSSACSHASAANGQKSGLARKDGLRQRADKGWGVRYFLGDFIIHHSHISLCFHAREKPLLSRPRLPPCLHCPRAAPGGAADRGLALSRPSAPGRSAGNRDRGMREMQGMQGMQDMRGMQGRRASPALPACVFSRLGRGHKRHYRVTATSCFVSASTRSRRKIAL